MAVAITGTPNVQSNTNSLTDKTLTFTSQTYGAGEVLIVVVDQNADAAFPGTGTPSGGSLTWTLIKDQQGVSGSFSRTTAWWATTGAGGTYSVTQTTTRSVGGLSTRGVLYRLTGADTTTPVPAGGAVGFQSTTTDPLLTNTNLQLTTGQAGSLFFCAGTDWSAGTSTVNLDSGLTPTTDMNATEASQATFIAFRSDALAADDNDVRAEMDTQPGTNSGNWSAIFFEIRAAGGAAPPDVGFDFARVVSPGLFAPGSQFLAEGMPPDPLAVSGLDLVDARVIAVQAAGPSQVSTFGLTLADTPVGATRAAGPSQTVAFGLSLIDVGAAARAGSPGQSFSLASGPPLNLTDTPTGTRAASPPQVSTFGLTRVDIPAATRASGPTQTVTFGLTVTDIPVGTRAAGPSQTLSVSAAPLNLTDTPRAVRAATRREIAAGINVVFVTSTNTTYATRTNTAVTVPGGIVPGDYVLLGILNGGASPVTPTPPAGFTLLPNYPLDAAQTDNAFHVVTRVYGGFVTGSEGATWTFTHASGASQGFALVYRNVDATTPLDSQPTVATRISTEGATNLWVAPGAMAWNAGSMAVFIAQDWGDTANNLTPPTGFTERIDVTLCYAADKLMTSATASLAPSMTNNSSGTVSSWGATQIILKPGLGYTPALSGVAAENALPGQQPSEWDRSTGFDTNAYGFAASYSVDAGTTLNFKIHCPAGGTLDIFRLGYYAGNGARKWASVTIPSTTQSDGSTSSNGEGGVGSVDCSSWTTACSWAVPSTAVPGVYCATIKRSFGTTHQQIFFVVKNGAATTNADLLVRMPELTWAAYNAFGTIASPTNGKSLYGQGANVSNQSARAWDVSFNRPLTLRSAPNVNGYMVIVHPIVSFLERQGYSIGYVSSLDVHNDASLLLNHQAMLSVGHDEYWSPELRTAWDDAITAGVNAFIMSANTMLWKVRVSGSTMTCYKDSHTLDGTGSGRDPVTWTGTWRDSRSPGVSPQPPHDPETRSTGMWFIANGIRNDEILVRFADKTAPMWRNCAGVQALTSGTTYNISQDILGFEFDYLRPSDPNQPTGTITLSGTSVDLTSNAADINGSIYTTTPSPNPVTHNIIAFPASSGALVVNLGTNNWGWALDSYHDLGTSSTVDVNAQQATVNVLRDMGVIATTLQAELTAPTYQRSAWFGASPTSVSDRPTAARAASPSQTVTFGLTLTDAPSSVRAAAPSQAATFGLALTDAPSGARAATPGQTLSLTGGPPLALTDAPVGSRAAGAPQTATFGLSVADLPVGARAGAPTQTVTFGLTLADSPKSVRGGTPSQTLDLTGGPPLALTDRPIGARTGAPNQTFIFGITFVDTPGGVRAGTPATAFGLSLILTDRPTAARSGASPQTVTFGLTLTDTPAAARGAGTGTTVVIALTIAVPPAAARAAQPPAATLNSGVGTPLALTARPGPAFARAVIALTVILRTPLPATATGKLAAATSTGTVTAATSTGAITAATSTGGSYP
jgi:hypothetical protein